MTWRRHAGDSAFHAGSENGGSFATFCSGRWPLADELEGLVEHQPSPPHDERCEACQRHAIDVSRIDTGLRELAHAEAVTSPHERFDLGGEA